MAGRIEGRTAVVTGGCSGIGLATVRRFVEEGARVVIGDIDDAGGEALVAELGGPDVATYVHVDVTSKDAPCMGDNCPYKSPIHGAMVAGVVLVTAGLFGILFNATRSNVKTTR